MDWFFVLQTFHIFFSGCEHVIIEEEHADDDACLYAADGIDVLVSEGFTIDFDVIVDDKHLSIDSDGVEEEEGVVAEEASKWVSFEQIIEVSVDICHTPYDHHCCKTQSVALACHENQWHDISAQNLEESSNDAAFWHPQNDKNNLDYLEKLDASQN